MTHDAMTVFEISGVCLGIGGFIWLIFSVLKG